MSKEDFIQYLIINYKLPKSGFKLKRIINSDKIVVYLIYLNIETKISLYYESIIELINKRRLTNTENYEVCIGTAFINSRKFYLNRCLYQH